MRTILLPPFIRDSRGNRLQKAATRKIRDSDHTRLYLSGPEEVAKQLVWALQGSGARQILLSDEQKRHWTHRIHVNGAIPEHASGLIELLKRVLTLTEREPLDVAIALDFYKDPESNEDPQKWKDTAAGSMVNAAKYYGNLEALEDLAESLAQVIRQHPLYAGADYIVAVPGHKSDHTSFGERLAEAVAEKVNKPVVRPSTTHEEREAAKTREQGQGARSLEDEFAFDTSVRGRVLVVVDDVHRSGNTMVAIAGAAKAAGAVSVLGLAGAQTMRR
jgi:adenine/guanine phosphoribosyltransferase-like PRPP-binding protein